MNISPEPRSQCDPMEKGALALFLLDFLLMRRFWHTMTKIEQYEQEKRKIAEKGLSHEEYEKAMRKLCRKYKV